MTHVHVRQSFAGCCRCKPIHRCPYQTCLIGCARLPCTGIGSRIACSLGSRPLYTFMFAMQRRVDDVVCTCECHCAWARFFSWPRFDFELDFISNEGGTMFHDVPVESTAVFERCKYEGGAVLRSKATRTPLTTLLAGLPAKVPAERKSIQRPREWQKNALETWAETLHEWNDRQRSVLPCVDGEGPLDAAALHELDEATEHDSVSKSVFSEFREASPEKDDAEPDFRGQSGTFADAVSGCQDRSGRDVLQAAWHVPVVSLRDQFVPRASSSLPCLAVGHDPTKKNPLYCSSLHLWQGVHKPTVKDSWRCILS